MGVESTEDPRARCVVGTAADLPAGTHRIVSLNGESVGVFNVGGKYHAIQNRCPHQGGPLCLGQLTGTTQAEDPDTVSWVRVGEIVRCPWHNWEFDIITGRALFNPNRRVKTYDVHLEPPSGNGVSDENSDDWLVVVEA